MFQQKTAYRGSQFPFDHSDVDYSPGICPEAERILSSSIRLTINEFFSETDIEEMISGIHKVAEYYTVKD